MPKGNSPSGDVMQMPSPATSKWGLGREARAALLRVRTRSEYPEDNLMALTWVRASWVLTWHSGIESSSMLIRSFVTSVLCGCRTEVPDLFAAIV